MSEQFWLQLIGAVVSIATLGGTAFAAYMAYKMAALKLQQDATAKAQEANAAASKKRYEKLDETCRQVEEKTDQQTVLLNQIKGDAGKAAEAAVVAADLTQSALARAAEQPKA